MGELLLGRIWISWEMKEKVLSCNSLEWLGDSTGCFKCQSLTTGRWVGDGGVILLISGLGHHAFVLSPSEGSSLQVGERSCPSHRAQLESLTLRWARISDVVST